MQGENASAAQKEEGKGLFTGWKKFFAPPTMVQQEEKLETMDPTSRLSFDFMFKQLDILMASTQDANMRAQYAYVKADMEIDRVKSKYAEDFIWDFVRWIEGISEKNVVFEPQEIDPNGVDAAQMNVIDEFPIITPWGNKPYTHLPDVKDFLDSIVDQKASVEKFIAKLRLRWPRNLPELWFWYKYIVHKQAIDGTVIEYARAIEPYEFLPRDRLPENPETDAPNPTYPYYDDNPDEPLDPTGPYKGPSWNVAPQDPYNPNPPRYNGFAYHFKNRLRGLILDEQVGPAAIKNFYQNNIERNNWAFDRTTLEEFASHIAGLIDNVADPNRAAALRGAFGLRVADNGLPVQPNQIVDNILIAQGIGNAIQQHLANNPLRLNIQQPQQQPQPQPQHQQEVQQLQQDIVALQQQMQQMAVNHQNALQNQQLQAQIALLEQQLANAQQQQPQQVVEQQPAPVQVPAPAPAIVIDQNIQNQLGIAKAQAEQAKIELEKKKIEYEMAEKTTEVERMKAEARVREAEQKIKNTEYMLEVFKEKAKNSPAPVLAEDVKTVLEKGLNDLVAAVSTNKSVADPEKIKEVSSIIAANPDVASQVDDAFQKKIDLFGSRVDEASKKLNDFVQSKVPITDLTPITRLNELLAAVTIPSEIKITGHEKLPASIPVVYNQPAVVMPVAVGGNESPLPQNILSGPAAMKSSEPHPMPIENKVTVELGKDFAKEFLEAYKNIQQQVSPSPVNQKDSAKKVKEAAQKIEKKAKESLTKEDLESFKTDLVNAVTTGLQGTNFSFSMPFTDTQVNELKTTVATLVAERNTYKDQFDKVTELYANLVKEAQKVKDLPKEDKKALEDAMVESSSLETLKDSISKEFSSLKPVLDDLLDEQKKTRAALEISNTQRAAVGQAIINTNTALDTIRIQQVSQMNTLGNGINALGTVINKNASESQHILNQVLTGITDGNAAKNAVSHTIGQAVSSLGEAVNLLRDQKSSAREAANKMGQIERSMVAFVGSVLQSGNSAMRREEEEEEEEEEPKTLTDLLREGPTVEEIESDDEEGEVVDEDTYPPFAIGYFEADEEIQKHPEKDEVITQAATQATEATKKAADLGVVPPVVTSLVLYVAKGASALPELQTADTVNTLTSIADPNSPETVSEQVDQISKAAVETATIVLNNPNAQPGDKQEAAKILEEVVLLADGSSATTSLSKTKNLEQASKKQENWRDEVDKMRPSGKSEQVSALSDQILSVMDQADKSVFGYLGIDNVDKAQKFVSEIARNEIASGVEPTFDSLKAKVVTKLERMVAAKKQKESFTQISTTIDQFSDQVTSFVRNFIDSTGKLTNHQDLPGQDSPEYNIAANLFSSSAENLMKPEQREARDDFFSYAKYLDNYTMKFQDIMDTLEGFGMEDTNIYKEAASRLEELDQLHLQNLEDSRRGFEQLKTSLATWKSRGQYEYRGWAVAMNDALTKLMTELSIVPTSKDLAGDFGDIAKSAADELKDSIKMLPGLTPLSKQNQNNQARIAQLQESQKITKQIQEKLKIIEKDITKGMFNYLRAQKAEEYRRANFAKSGAPEINNAIGEAKSAYKQYLTEHSRGMGEVKLPLDESGLVVLPNNSLLGKKMSRNDSNVLKDAAAKVNSGELEEIDYEQLLNDILEDMGKNRMKDASLSQKEREKRSKLYEKVNQREKDLIGEQEASETRKKFYGNPKNFQKKPSNAPLSSEEMKYAATYFTGNIYAGLETDEQVEYFQKTGKLKLKPGSKEEQIYKLSKANLAAERRFEPNRLRDPKNPSLGRERGQFGNTTAYMQEWSLKHPNEPAAKKFLEQQEAKKIGTKEWLQKPKTKKTKSKWKF